MYSITANNYTVYTSLGNVNLTPGYYTSSTFTSHLQTKLQTVDANYTATFDNNTKKLTITNTGAFTLNFGTNTTNSANRLMGFKAADTASGTSVTADYIVNLVSATSILFDFHSTSNPIETTNEDSNNRGEVYIAFDGAAFGSYNRFDYDDNGTILHFDKLQQRISVDLWDADGNSLSINGTDFEILLERIEY